MSLVRSTGMIMERRKSYEPLAVSYELVDYIRIKWFREFLARSSKLIAKS